ncbi:hypothetical protein BC937DRAFT_91582, partial [Endogone sp. FLAS-F59071]
MTPTPISLPWDTAEQELVRGGGSSSLTGGRARAGRQRHTNPHVLSSISGQGLGLRPTNCNIILESRSC